jgi:hypothetical protein
MRRGVLDVVDLRVGDELDLFSEVLMLYLAYVRQPAEGKVSVGIPIGDAMGLSARAHERGCCWDNCS